MSEVPPLAKPSNPELDFSPYGETETVALSKIQKLGGQRLTKNWVSIPHVTHNDEADVTDLEARRAAHNARHPGSKVTSLAYQVKAVVSGLQAFPYFNSSLNADTGEVILKRYFHIGIAIDTPKGLVVGVVKDCDKKSPLEIAGDIAAMAEKARTRGLGYADMMGACFTISSLGGFGGTSFTPIINAPEVAILGLTRVQERPRRGPGDGLEWRRMLPLSLSYDHRVLNGADAAKFVAHVANALATPASVGLGEN